MRPSHSLREHGPFSSRIEPRALAVMAETSLFPVTACDRGRAEVTLSDQCDRS